MSIAVTCPQCRNDVEVPSDRTGAMRCQRCGVTFSVDEAPSPRRPTARAAFPWGPVAIVTIGILFMLLTFSVGFNIWFILDPDHHRLRLDEAMEAEQMAKEQRMQAEQMREKAIRQEKESQQQLERLQQELARARKDLDDAQFELANVPDRPDLAWGTLEGRVTWKGPLPKVEGLEEKIGKHPDAAYVLKAPKDLLVDPTWRIDPKTGGVANVCVFIKRPKDGHLPIHVDDKVRKAPVVIDAPFLVFEPHMTAVYPQWFDGKYKGRTGQKLYFKNSSKAVYTARGQGVPDINPGFNVATPLGREFEAVVHPQGLPIMIFCDIHVWMKAYAWVFDHPYYAITKADGTFTIPRVPAGMELQVMAWHEAQGWLFTKNGKTMTLKAGKNTLDFEMSAK
jgi:hypothetical protein